jgi:hypothetical protein
MVVKKGRRDQVGMGADHHQKAAGCWIPCRGGVEGTGNGQGDRFDDSSSSCGVGGDKGPQEQLGDGYRVAQTQHTSPTHCSYDPERKTFPEGGDLNGAAELEGAT